MTVEFSKNELNKIPAQFHPLMQEYPNCFHTLLDAMVTPWHPPAAFELIEVFFDDEHRPALSFEEGSCMAFEATEDPTIISVFGNNELLKMEICNFSVLNRKELADLKIFRFKS